jgi:hypothetical protein
LKASKGAADKTPANIFKPAAGDNNKGRPLYRVGPMRELLILSASTNAALSDIFCKQVGKSTLVETLQSYRDQSFCGYDMVDFLCRMTKVARPTTALGYLETDSRRLTIFESIGPLLQKVHLGSQVSGTGGFVRMYR